MTKFFLLKAWYAECQQVQNTLDSWVLHCQRLRTNHPKTKQRKESSKNAIFSLPLCVGRDRSSSCLVLTFSLRSKNSTAVPLAQHGPTFGVAGTVLFLHIYAQSHIDRGFSPRTSDFHLTSPPRLVDCSSQRRVVLLHCSVFKWGGQRHPVPHLNIKQSPMI